MHHRVLQRQMKKFGVEPDHPPRAQEEWARFLEHVDRFYHEADQDRYLLERSLSISSREMREIYEKLLEASESRVAAERNRLRAVISSLGAGLCTLDEQGRVLSINPEGERLLGCTEADVLELPFFAWTVSSGDGQALGGPCSLEEVMASGQPCREEDGAFVRKDGRRLPVSYTINPIIEEGTLRGAVLVFFDITERKEAEQALRESEQRFRDLFESSPDAIFVEDLDGNVIDVNPASCQLHGLTREQLIGQNVRALVPPEQHQNAMEVFAQMVAGELDRIEGESWTVENKEVPVEISVSRITHSGQPAVLLQVRDITERKEAEQELARINAKLEQRNRELQDFAYAASHDLQEPLRKIRAFADLMQEDYGDKVDETGHYYLDRMQDAAARMSGLITDLLAYSRVTTKVRPFGRVDLNAVVADVLSDLEMQIEETNGRITLGNLPAIEADATQMHQLLQNFIGNALKFHQAGVPPVVELIGHLEQQRARDGDAPQTVCRLEVRDNGIGFDEKYLDRIFTPFQRLHGRSAYAGTGMGLAICRRIVERHHGALTARSAPGEGATFIVTLPVYQRSARREAREGGSNS